MDNPTKILEAALNCFVPPLDPEARVRVAAALQELATEYRNYAQVGPRGPAPIRKIYTLVRNYRRFETDEEYAKRLTFWKTQPRRGRPRNFAAQVLVANLRDRLMVEGCDYGAPKEQPHTRLADLARLIHLLSGLEGSMPGWQDIAEQCADPIFRMKLAVGEGFSFDPENTTEVKRMLTKAEVLPPKRPRSPKKPG